MQRIFTYTIHKNFAGKPVIAVLRNHFQMSSSIIKTLKNTENGIMVNGSSRRVDFILTPGDQLRLTLADGKSENIVPAKVDFEIVFEDEDLVIINKPSGVATHPSQGHYDNTLANGLMYYFAQKNEPYTFRAVNRLDKDTSGLLCTTKNSYAHSRLCAELHKRFERRYLAIVEGSLTKPGTIDSPIARCADSMLERCVSPEGQPAVTHYRPLKTYRDFTLTELRLETGRTHQIRVHMASIGHPLLGDWLYGKEDKTLFPRTALHSSYIRFPHPVTGKPMEFTAPPAPDMMDFLNKLS